MDKLKTILIMLCILIFGILAGRFSMQIERAYNPSPIITKYVEKECSVHYLMLEYRLLKDMPDAKAGTIYSFNSWWKNWYPIVDGDKIDTNKKGYDESDLINTDFFEPICE